MKKRTKNAIFLGLFTISFVANIIGIIAQNNKIVSIAIPSIFISLIVMYIGSVKKPNTYFMIYLLLSLTSETLFLFKESYFFYVLLTSTIAQIILIAFIISFKHLRYSETLFYLVATIIFYFVIYTYVIKMPKNIMLIVNGLINAILAAVAMSNYLRKMYLANYLLFLGIAFKVLNYAIASIDLFDVNANIYASITDIISYFFICRSFIIRVNRPRKRKKYNY